MAVWVMRSAGPAVGDQQTVAAEGRAGAPASALTGTPGTRDPMSRSTGAAQASDAVGPSGSPALPGVPDWWWILSELDARRSHALEAGDASLVPRYAVPGSPASDADGRLVQDLVERGLRPVGLGSQILAIEAQQQVPGGVSLQVVDLRSGYELVSAATGTVVDHVGAAPATRWTVILAPRTTEQAEGLGWRIVSVERLGSGGTEP